MKTRVVAMIRYVFAGHGTIGRVLSNVDFFKMTKKVALMRERIETMLFGRGCPCETRPCDSFTALCSRKAGAKAFAGPDQTCGSLGLQFRKEF